jgi:WD40 repeat protein
VVNFFEKKVRMMHFQGSLDGSLKIWDVSSAKEVGSYTFPSQIFSLTVCPGESWVAVGYVAMVSINNKKSVSKIAT